MKVIYKFEFYIADTGEVVDSHISTNPLDGKLYLDEYCPGTKLRTYSAVVYTSELDWIVEN